jgi:hypothetical protein
MPFELLDPTDATLTSVTPRTETHGDERVFAISLGLKMTAANTMLDSLAPGLRDALYTAVEGQEQLPGVEVTTPLLRTKVIDTVSLDRSFEGWTLAVDHGIDESAPILLGGAKVDKFRVVPREGGSVDITFRVGSSDIDAEEAGLLCSHLSQSVSITLRAPEAHQPEAVIDGTTAAFQAAHPDATDLFAQQAASDASITEGESGDVDDPDDAAEEGSEGGQPDAAADFEAGAREAVEKARSSRRRGARAH